MISAYNIVVVLRKESIMVSIFIHQASYKTVPATAE